MKRPFSNADGEIIYFPREIIYVPALTLNSTGNNKVNELQKMYQVVHKMGYSYRKFILTGGVFLKYA